jgi:hypothetical protein
MRNQKGEAVLFCTLILVALSGLLTLCGLELQHHFSLMKKRTHLFLCTKETKGELDLYLKSMGRLNWLLKNISKAQAVAIFYPPLWTVVENAEKLKRVTKILQAAELARYETQISKLKARGCPIDPQLILTPYKIGTDLGFQRRHDGSAIRRKQEWTYYFLEKPYLLTLKVNTTKNESIRPKILYESMERGAILSYHLSSR